METIDERATEALLDGRYRLGPCIGRGGTAAVYRAMDTILGRTVAIKLLRQADEMPYSMERIHSETAVLASLNHPSLVTLYDAKLAPGHLQYLVMEHVDGSTLAARLHRGPLPSADAASLAVDLAEALQVVHEAGIIHRDVKPSNVLLARAPRRASGWTAKLTDFGIAFSLGDARQTSPGVAVGTAAYMAPEQVRTDDLTPAVDVYSLGLVLIEALTGQPAFPITGGVQTALRRIAVAPPIPDSLGPSWVALLERMTRLAPEERPSAEEVALAATALRDDPAAHDIPKVHAMPTAVLPVRTDAGTGPTRQITAPVPAPPRRRRRRRTRAPIVAALSAMAAAVVAAVVLVGGIWTFGSGDSPPRSASLRTVDLRTTQPAEQTLTTDQANEQADEAEQTATPIEQADQTDAPVQQAEQPDPPAVPTDQQPETVATTTTDGGNGNEKSPNPNKGPGNNSGNQNSSGDDEK